MKNIIEIKNVSKEFKIRANKNIFTGLFSPQYKHVLAVDDVSFSVSEGESLAFLGPNGAGKTTTTKMLSGLIYPTSGELSVLGYNPFNRENAFLRQIGLVMGSKSGLNWDLTPNQSFKLLKLIYKLSDKVYEQTLSTLVDLLDVRDYLDIQVRRLSLGQRMKLELIGAILHSPKVLFLDEPTIGLDITSKKNIRQFLKKLQQEFNITLILTSHDMDDVENVCDRVVIINKGKKVYDDNLASLVSEYSKEKHVQVFFDNKITSSSFEWLHQGSVSEVTQNSAKFEVPYDYFPTFLSSVVSKNDVLDIDVLSIPLEDIIEDVFKKEVQSLV